MNHFTRVAVLAPITIAALLAGCATDAPQASKPLPQSVPDIAIVIDCEKCEVGPTVPELIRTGYAAAAAKWGVPIARGTQFTVTIKDYSERGLAMRVVAVVAGPLAFALKDEIKAVATIDGKRWPLEHQERNPFQGMDAVAQRLGELSFDIVVK